MLPRLLHAVLYISTIWISPSQADDDKPQALVIPASEYFEGNDGPWSTFDIRVGSPGQDIRVLVSTTAPETLVPLSDLGCSSDVFDDIPSDCAVSRGNLFNINNSSSWTDGGQYEINQHGVGLEANLGYDQRVQFGLDHMGIGLTGPSLKNQTVGGIATADPFYLGIFGLSTQPMNFTSLGNYSAPSFLTTLKNNDKIPSLSWSYTAGAKYRLKQVYGQLIFSGYDTSRFEENTASFTMADDITRDLVVSLQSISYNGGSSSTLLSDSIDIFIDSTDPNIWLPEDVCDEFEKAFGLTLDDESGLYLINETYHNTLLDTNAEVAFRISDVNSGGDSVSIVLPYAAFGLTAKNPLVAKSSHYFPLKRAANSTQYTLGRVFLQEAYLTADYERQVFNVSACVWNQGAEEKVVTITSKDDDSDSGSGSGGSSGDSSPSGGTLAGIIVGSVIGGILIIALLTVILLRKRRKWMKAGFAHGATEPEPDESMLKGPVFNSGDRSTQYNSTGISPANVSDPLSTTNVSGSAAHSSSLKPVAMGESANSGSTPELDGHGTHVRPRPEIDGTEIQHPDPSQPIAKNPGVYELPGSRVPVNRGADSDQTPSIIGEGEMREGDTDTPPSPFVSTLGTAWGQDDRGDAGIVSPSTPVHRGPRPF